MSKRVFEPIEPVSIGAYDGVTLTFETFISEYGFKAVKVFINGVWFIQMRLDNLDKMIDDMQNVYYNHHNENL